MGVYLRSTGQRTEALPPSLEAVNIYRELAKFNKDFRPDLASTLNNLGVRLSELGQRAKALQSFQESVRNDMLYLCRELPLLPEANGKS
jgi:tetratricopeptide (TPR) repeat protein